MSLPGMTINDLAVRVSWRRVPPALPPTADVPAEPARADEHHRARPALSEQDLQPLTRQRMERMGDDNETRRITGRCGALPPPWRCRAAAAAHPPSGCMPACSAMPGSAPAAPVRAGPEG